MRLNLHQLPAHAKRPLLPVYLVAGDEPLQRGEALDLLRAAAKAQGHSEREILEHDAQFDWRDLGAIADNLSLFGDRRLIELRLSSAKIGADGSSAVVAYTKRPPEDTVLLIISPKLDRSQNSSKWVKAVEQAGAMLQVWPVERNQLPSWLEKRMRGKGLQPGPGVAGWLAERVEGNLLAGVQEVEKLLLRHNPGPINLEDLRETVGDSARFTIFDLADSALEGQSARSVRILRTLMAEGTAEPLVLWALTRETRLLASLTADVAGGRSLTQAIAGRREILERRRSLYAKAADRLTPACLMLLLRRCAMTDRAIKGEENTDPWLVLEDIALGLCGSRIPAAEFTDAWPALG